MNLTWAQLQVYPNTYTLLQLVSPITDVWAPLVIIFFLHLPSPISSSLPRIGPPWPALPSPLPSLRDEDPPPLPSLRDEDPSPRPRFPLSNRAAQLPTTRNRCICPLNRAAQLLRRNQTGGAEVGSGGGDQERARNRRR
jgi:hypothetical protein